MKKKIYDTPQDIILESLSIKDYKDIRLPADDFLDDGSASSFSDSENMREPNNNDGEKKNFVLVTISMKSIVHIIFVKQY